MSRAVSRLLPCCLLLLMAAGAAHARSATARIDRVVTAVATLEGVRVDLAWPPESDHGELRLRARHAIAPALGYEFHDLDWRCPLQRTGDGWQCAGELRGGGAPVRLSVSLGDDTAATVSRGRSRIDLKRDGDSPAMTRINLVEVPVAWTQALLAQAWPTGRITGGTVEAALAIAASDDGPLRVSGPLELREGGFDTPGGTIAGQGLDARLYVDAQLGEPARFSVEGRLLGGELLFGTTYISLQQRPVDVLVQAEEDAGGWRLPRLLWRDPGILAAEGSAGIGAGGALRMLEVDLRSPDLTPLAEFYLGGWLGMAGLGGAQLEGAADGHLRIDQGQLRQAVLSLQQAGIDDPSGRFTFHGVDGDLRFSAGLPVTSELRWEGGALYGLPFGPARLPLRSGDGELVLARPVELPILGGRARLTHLQLRPPGAGGATDLRFGLALEELDVGELAKALDWPAFTGRISGSIPEARYVDEVLKFDGGLAMQLFGGTVSVTSLAMERPFGVLPTVSADVAIDDIGLMPLTGAFDFGSISGKLDGRIDGLRLVDWTPVAFDAWLATERHPGVRQRISQRAVQDLSSVGNSSFVGGLQAQLIGFFDDFGYSRIGIGCRLVDEVCTMEGLGSAGEGFIIVRGSGLPRLTVVGYNRRVDWPTLVERLAAVGSGDVAPVVD